MWLTQDRPTRANWPDMWLVKVLMDRDVLRSEDVDLLLEARERTAWLSCTRNGIATDEEILAAVSVQYGLPLADLTGIDAEAAGLLKESFARVHRVAPLRMDGRVLEVATWDAEALTLEADVAFASGRRARVFLVSPAQLDELLERLYPASASGARTGFALGLHGRADSGSAGAEREIPLERLMSLLITQALREQATDILLDPDPLGLTVRLRVDGKLMDMQRWPLGLSGPIVCHLKSLAALDLAERVRPQDGRAELNVNGRSVRVLIGILPIKGRGETAAIRILDAGVVHAVAQSA